MRNHVTDWEDPDSARRKIMENNSFSKTAAVSHHFTLCSVLSSSLSHSQVSHHLLSFNAFLHTEATDQMLCFSKLLGVTFGAMEDDMGEWLPCRDAAGKVAWTTLLAAVLGMDLGYSSLNIGQTYPYSNG